MLQNPMLTAMQNLNGRRRIFPNSKEEHSMAIIRSDGRVGTANYWLFIPTVFCENRNLDVIREAMHNELGYAVTINTNNIPINC